MAQDLLFTLGFWVLTSSHRADARPSHPVTRAALSTLGRRSPPHRCVLVLLSSLTDNLFNQRSLFLCSLVGHINRIKDPKVLYARTECARLFLTCVSTRPVLSREPRLAAQSTVGSMLSRFCLLLRILLGNGLLALPLLAFSSSSRIHLEYLLFIFVREKAGSAASSAAPTTSREALPTSATPETRLRKPSSTPRRLAHRDNTAQASCPGQTEYKSHKTAHMPFAGDICKMILQLWWARRPQQSHGRSRAQNRVRTHVIYQMIMKKVLD